MNAARRVLWLHAVGGVVAIMLVVTGSGFAAGLHALKVLVHAFGGFAAWRATRA